MILATSLVETLHKAYPDAKIDVMLRKGNESLFVHHPFLHKVLILDRKRKIRSVRAILKFVRKSHYDAIINPHRFGSSGLITWLSGAKQKFGFNKNPFSFSYTKAYDHNIGNGEHEIERNHRLISTLTDLPPARPALYPSAKDAEKVAREGNYVVMAPASVWFTKQMPMEKWVDLINLIPEDIRILFVGAPGDQELCTRIINASKRREAENLAGKLSLLQSAALMKGARMNYVNDSAPQHLCSAVNAPVTTFFCSTVPEFGFGPLSENQHIMQPKEELACRPCGLHGHEECPEGHFKCGWDMELPLNL